MVSMEQVCTATMSAFLFTGSLIEFWPGYQQSFHVNAIVAHFLDYNHFLANPFKFLNHQPSTICCYVVQNWQQDKPESPLIAVICPFRSLRQSYIRLYIQGAAS
jgi:hypothetical protein